MFIQLLINANVWTKEWVNYICVSTRVIFGAGTEKLVTTRIFGSVLDMVCVCMYACAKPLMHILHHSENSSLP